jgi:hypothetical protein
MTQFTCKGVKQINNRISFKHLYHSFLSAFFISVGVLLWLVRDQSRSKYYLRTKFQDGIDKPQKSQNVCYHPTYASKVTSTSKVVRLLFAQRFITIFNCRYHTSNHLSVYHKPTSLSPINCRTKADQSII